MVYARNAWYVVAWSEELDHEKPTAVMVLGEPIVLWHSQGQLVAMEDRCPHRLAPLSLGRCEDGNLRCMYHGFLFNKEGACLEIPGQDLIPDQAKVRKYRVADRHGWIWVWMGDNEEADEALIPSLVGPDEEGWLVATGTIDYEADAYLLNRNLLDFSHVPYVHASTFAQPEEQAYRLPKWQKIDRGLRYTLWTRGVMGSPAAPSEFLVDDMVGYDYLIPGILHMQTGHFPVGTADKCNDGRPDFKDAVGAVISSSQAVTPVDNGKTRYFFTIGPRADFGSQEMLDVLAQVQIDAFEEDKIMIEAQQKILEKSEGIPVIPTAHDRAVVMFEQMVTQMNSAR